MAFVEPSLGPERTDLEFVKTPRGKNFAITRLGSNSKERSYVMLVDSETGNVDFRGKDQESLLKLDAAERVLYLDDLDIGGNLRIVADKAEDAVETAKKALDKVAKVSETAKNALQKSTKASATSIKAVKAADSAETKAQRACSVAASAPKATLDKIKSEGLELAKGQTLKCEDGKLLVNGVDILSEIPALTAKIEKALNSTGEI